MSEERRRREKYKAGKWVEKVEVREGREEGI